MLAYSRYRGRKEATTNSKTSDWHLNINRLLDHPSMLHFLHVNHLHIALRKYIKASKTFKNWLQISITKSLTLFYRSLVYKETKMLTEFRFHGYVVFLFKKVASPQSHYQQKRQKKIYWSGEPGLLFELAI